jgi:hypothetical protein
MRCWCIFLPAEHPAGQAQDRGQRRRHAASAVSQLCSGRGGPQVCAQGTPAQAHAAASIPGHVCARAASDSKVRQWCEGGRRQQAAPAVRIAAVGEEARTQQVHQQQKGIAGAGAGIEDSSCRSSKSDIGLAGLLC